jgi:hypothetical protein
VVEQERRTQPLGEVRGHPAQEGHVGLGEGRIVPVAVQAQHPPTGAVAQQSGAQLVAEAERRQDLPVARALPQVPARRRVEAPDGRAAARERDELVRVVPQELVREEGGGRVFGDAFDHRSREQERGRVDRRAPERVEGGNRAQRLEDGEAQGPGVEARVAEPEDLPPRPRRRRGVHARASRASTIAPPPTR